MKLPTLTQIKMFAAVVGSWAAIINAIANSTSSPLWIRSVTAGVGGVILAVEHAYNKQTTTVSADRVLPPGQHVAPSSQKALSGPSTGPSTASSTVNPTTSEETH